MFIKHYVCQYPCTEYKIHPEDNTEKFGRYKLDGIYMLQFHLIFLYLFTCYSLGVGVCHRGVNFDAKLIAFRAIQLVTKSIFKLETAYDSSYKRVPT
jgi:hypothetical protein